MTPKDDETKGNAAHTCSPLQGMQQQQQQHEGADKHMSVICAHVSRVEEKEAMIQC